jgi:hypothetical protein
MDLNPAPGVPDRDYPWDWNRILSGFLALAWLTLCGLAGGTAAVLQGVLQAALPLACIWFPETLGSMTSMLPGALSDMPITRTSPGCLVRALGWVVLLLLTVGRIVIVAVMAP